MGVTSQAAGTTAGEPVFNVQPCLGDPVCRLVKERWRLRPWQAALVFLGVFGGGNFLAAWADGNAFPREGLALPFTGDVLALVLYVFIVPAGICLALRFYGQVESAFETIYSQGLVQAPRDDYNRFLQHLHRRYNSLGLHLGALVAAAVIFGLLTCRNEVQPGLTWLNLDAGVAGFVQLALGVIVWYTAVVMVWKIVVTTQALYRVFDWPVNIQPLHPDGCGGFSLFTRVAVTIALFTALFGLAVVLLVLGGSILYHTHVAPTPIIATIAFETLAPLLFFTFLYRAHVAMAGAKNSMLESIHAEFQRPFGALRGSLDRGEFDDAASARIVQLNELHEVVQNLPVWPTNTQILMQVGTSVAVPLGILGLQLLIERWAK